MREPPRKAGPVPKPTILPSSLLEIMASAGRLSSICCSALAPLVVELNTVVNSVDSVDLLVDERNPLLLLSKYVP